MQRNNNHFLANESVTVSPIIIHRLVEQIHILQKRLEQLERHNVISATQSLASISAAYDISPIPSRLSLLNIITEQDASDETSKSDMLTVRDRQPSASSSGSERPTMENMHNNNRYAASLTISKEESQQLMEALSRLEYLETYSETSSFKEQEIQTYESKRSSHAYESNDLEEKIDLSEDQWLSGGGSQTPSLSYSTSTDSISVDDRIASQASAIQASTPHISIEENPQYFFRSMTERLENQELPNVLYSDTPYTQPLPNTLEESELESTHDDMPISENVYTSQYDGVLSYGRCYSSFFPTTLLGSPITVHRSSARHSLAKSMTELTPMLKLSGSCLNLQDKIQYDNLPAIFSAGKNMSEGKDSAIPQISNVSRMKRWLQTKLTGSHKIKQSKSAPVLNSQLKNSFSFMFSKLSNMH